MKRHIHTPRVVLATLLSPVLLALCPAGASAQEVQNDATAPLHLMKPAYTIPYEIPTTQSVKATMDRIRDYISSNTYMELENSRTQEPVTNVKKIDADTQLKRGTFRLTSYEWGVTYSAMMRAAEVTGDKSYMKYAADRMAYLATLAPHFTSLLQSGKQIDVLMHQVVKPEALDDAGAICAAMLKLLKYDANGLDKKQQEAIQNQIKTYYDFVSRQQYRYKDGQFARLRPVRNTVWLDDMFMGIPALALNGEIDEAQRQFNLFHEKMWVSDRSLYRHGWVEGAYHPAFFWGRANGWALLTACELLDCKESPLIMTYFLEHLSGLLPLQHHDGAWHQLLDRNDTYLETSCTAIYCYCIAHAINKGWIDAETYGPAAILAWNYVNRNINQQGQVTGTCVGTGLAFDPAFYAYRPVNNFAAHGYGPAIWAAAEMYQFVKSNIIRMNDSAIHFYPEDPGTDEPIFYVK